MQNDLTIRSINNNTINVNSDTTQVTGIHVSWLNGLVKDNIFNSISTTATADGTNASGIVVTYDLSGVVSSNTFAYITSLSNAGCDNRSSRIRTT